MYDISNGNKKLLFFFTPTLIILFEGFKGFKVFNKKEKYTICHSFI